MEKFVKYLENINLLPMQTSGDLFNFFPVFFFRKPGDRQQICRGHLTEGKFCRRMAR